MKFHLSKVAILLIVNISHLQLAQASFFEFEESQFAPGSYCESQSRAYIFPINRPSEPIIGLDCYSERGWLGPKTYFQDLSSGHLVVYDGDESESGIFRFQASMAFLEKQIGPYRVIFEANSGSTELQITAQVPKEILRPYFAVKYPGLSHEFTREIVLASWSTRVRGRGLSTA